MGNSYQDNLAAATKLAHITPLGSLREKVNPNYAALIVIDMQNDFCARGGLVDNGGRDVSAVQDMARQLPALIESARKAGALVVFVRSVYTTEDNRYLSDVWLEQAARKQGGGYTQTPVCRDGSWEGDYYGDVRPQPGDSLAIFGVGAVGLSALMAAKIAGCDPIIAVDVHEHRLKLARELGATHTINHNGRTDVVEEIRKITGLGARYTLETSAIPSVSR